MFEVACGRSEGAIKSASRTVTHDSGILWCSYDAVEAEVLTYLDRLSLFSVSSSFGSGVACAVASSIDSMILTDGM